MNLKTILADSKIPKESQEIREDSLGCRESESVRQNPKEGEKNPKEYKRI